MVNIEYHQELINMPILLTPKTLSMPLYVGVCLYAIMSYLFGRSPIMSDNKGSSPPPPPPPPPPDTNTGVEIKEGGKR